MPRFQRLQALPAASGTEPGTITPSTYNAIRKALIELDKRFDRIELLSSPDITIKNSESGYTAILKRRSTSSASAPCSFGAVYSPVGETVTRAILGGALMCGDQNFAVPHYTVATSTDGAADGEWLVEISLSGIEFATDDDDVVFLPGVVTASGTPAWNLVSYSGVENYTDNTNPSTPGGSGTIVIPIGRIIVTNDAVQFFPTGCGDIYVTQCAGILRFTRGG